MGFLVSSLPLPTSCITPSILLRKGFGFLGRVSRGCLGGRVLKGIGEGACRWHIWWRLVWGVGLAVWLFGLSGFHINPLSWRSNGVSSQRLAGFWTFLVSFLGRSGVFVLFLNSEEKVSHPQPRKSPQASILTTIMECQHPRIYQRHYRMSAF